MITRSSKRLRTKAQCNVQLKDTDSFFDVRHVEMEPGEAWHYQTNEPGEAWPWATQILRPEEETWITIQRVSAAYSLMPHQDLVGRLNESVTCGFGPGGTICVDFGNKLSTQAGMLAVVDHPCFPQVNVALPGESEDLVRFQLVAFNSYDKSKALEVALGAVRFVCTNGMYFPSYLFAALKFIHYRQHDWTTLHAQIKEMLEHAALRCKGLWLAMKGHALTDEDREDFRNAFCDEELIPLNRAIDEAFDDRDDEASLWDLYNACTHYATHCVQGEEARLIHERIAEYFYPQEEVEEKRDPTFVLSPTPSPSSPSSSPRDADYSSDDLNDASDSSGDESNEGSGDDDEEASEEASEEED